jgi:hypothetical protein
MTNAHHRNRRETGRRSVGRLLVGLGVALSATAVVASPAPAQTAPRTFHVDCVNGADSRSGLSPTTAWKTMAKANSASLMPGDSLLFATGCRFRGRALTAKWQGTATSPVRIGAYGTGSAPVIADATQIANVIVSGKHQVIRDLRLEHNITNTVACDQPIGTVYGVVFNNGASFNTFRNSHVTGATAGVHLSKSSSDNRILHNMLAENRTLQTWGANPAHDLGAWGALVRSDRNEIAYNTFWDNSAKCRNQGYRLMSNSVEIYEGSGNRIHHNRSFGDRVFSELGSSSTKKAADNVFAYNVFMPNKAESRFITTRGAGDATYGPVHTTRAEYNTIYATGQDAQGIVCILGCSPSIMSATSNIIHADAKIVFADQPFTFVNNVVWASNGAPFVQVHRSQTLPGLVRADPMFSNPAVGNFTLRAGSPAIDRATAPIVYDFDLDRNSVPFNGIPDIGAYEFVS